MQCESQIVLLKHLAELEYKQAQLFIRQEEIKNRLSDLLIKKEDKFEMVRKIFDAKGYYLSLKKRENSIASLTEAKAMIDENVSELDREIQMYSELLKTSVSSNRAIFVADLEELKEHSI